MKFEFKSLFTVAIGNNGLGKSSLLNAVQVALGAYLQAIPTLPANYLYRRQFRKGERFVRYNNESKDFAPNLENPLIEVEAKWYNPSNENEQLINWQREFLASNSTTHKTSHSNQIIDFANYLYSNHISNQDIVYPVVANFQINRTNAEVKKVDKSWKRMSRLEKGYYAALGESVNFTGVYEWLYSYDKLVLDKKEFEGTKEAMFNAILTAVPFIKEIDYDIKFDEFEVLVDFEDGQVLERKLSSNLSDGMKAMLNMVAEIAYRCIMLNGKMGTDAVKRSTGVVLIDELDMHLHPKWQKQVVRNLKEAFPAIQFIVTTHSPFIVQSLLTEELINLDSVSHGLDDDPHKYSIEEVSELEMGVEDIQRSELFMSMQNAAAEYFELVKNREDPTSIERAKEKLSALRVKFSNDPAYIALLQSELPKAQ